MSDLLAIQDNSPKASAEELQRTDLLHMTTKEQNIHKEYLPDSYVLVHYRTGLPPTRLHKNLKGPMRVIKVLNSLYTLLDLITGKEKDYHVSVLFKKIASNKSSRRRLNTGSALEATPVSTEVGTSATSTPSV